jgi:DNA-binding PadR family transcriptional regulator
MLYPLLHRLERLGHVEASWGTSAEGRRRKVYRLTARGEAVLAEHRAQWDMVGRALQRAWGHHSGQARSALGEA